MIELLVVIAIIAVLIGLLLPAVQSAREAARRAQCLKNLKQIGIAMAAYESAIGVYPSASDYYYYPSGALYSCGWSVRILPYLEQRQIFDSYNFTFTFTDWPNQTAVKSSISTFVCPSAPLGQEVVPGLSNVSGIDLNLSAARSDYFVARSVVPLWYTSNRQQLPTALQWSASTPIAAVTDGLSNTMLAYEVAGMPDYYNEGNLQRTYTPNVAEGVYAFFGIWGGYMSMRLVTFKGSTANNSCVVNCHWGWDYDGPCMINCHNGQDGIYSFHPGGINALACDGSVRFIKETIFPSIFMAFATRAQGEILSADNF